ncbi:hypothetical protein GQ55_9G021100 [Panicum hallii var. hallii]|uniref:Pectinesterase inhibitor domain-containing protein n=1 Tax=Panicum hallii var. hallii TaxID=1504633 RepID=A0A2T7BYU2_9POAL|nr:hypothetical protein GQ55_9G021100 [Panicum hallii var. hallii]
MQSRRARPDSCALASAGTSLLLCFSALHALPASVSPGASSIVSTCMTGPYPELCVHELGQRLQDIQTAIASAAPKQGARIAGAPGRGRRWWRWPCRRRRRPARCRRPSWRASSRGSTPACPTSASAWATNCSATMSTAMQKLHGASAALRSGATDVAKNLASRSFTDASSCSVSCEDLSGDVRLIIVQSLTEFQKMLHIAITFINKTKKPNNPLPLPRS